MNKNPILKIQTEAKLIQDQIEAESTVDQDINKFIELENKKYKKADEPQDMINKD